VIARCSAPSSVRASPRLDDEARGTSGARRARALAGCPHRCGGAGGMDERRTTAAVTCCISASGVSNASSRPRCLRRAGRIPWRAMPTPEVRDIPPRDRPRTPRRAALRRRRFDVKRGPWPAASKVEAEAAGTAVANLDPRDPREERRTSLEGCEGGFLVGIPEAPRPCRMPAVAPFGPRMSARKRRTALRTVTPRLAADFEQSERSSRVDIDEQGRHASTVTTARRGRRPSSLRARSRGREGGARRAPSPTPPACRRTARS
jgi:hypothetical protein